MEEEIKIKITETERIVIFATLRDGFKEDVKFLSSKLERATSDGQDSMFDELDFWIKRLEFYKALMQKFMVKIL